MSGPSDVREGYEGTLTFVGGSLNGTTMDFYDAVPERDQVIETAFGDVYEFRLGDDWKVHARQQDARGERRRQ